MLLNPKYFGRYADIARLLTQYGLDDIIGVFGLEHLVPRAARETMLLRGRTRPERLRLLLEHLGPVYVKLGQVLSTRPDILPTEYLVELEFLPRFDVISNQVHVDNPIAIDKNDPILFHFFPCSFISRYLA